MFIVLLQLAKQHNPDYPSMTKGLREQGHRVYFGHLDGAGQLIWETGEENAPLLETAPINALGQGLLSDFHERLGQLLRGLNPDVVQFNNSMLRNAWRLKRELPAQMLFIQDVKQINLRVNNSMKARARDMKAVLSLVANARIICDHTLFDYHYAAEETLGPDWQRWSSVVPVGIAPELLLLPRPAEPAAGADKPVRFVYVGSLNRFRELEILLGGARLLADRTDRFQIDIIGPDRADGYYHELLQEWDLAHRVQLLPPVAHEQIPQTLNDGYDVGLAYNPIRPTWHYQPTIKILEYRALGMPIISSDVRSHRDYVQQRVNGLLVDNTEVAWAEAMASFVSDRAFLRQSHQQALAMRSGNTIADVAKMHERVYDKLLSER